jgi:hypothetical protein
MQVPQTATPWSRRIATSTRPVVVFAARRPPGAPFGPLADVSTAQFVSDAFGAQAAMGNGGRALVT